MKKYYDDPKHNAAFDRCIDVMMQLIQKYGPQLLEQEPNKQQRGQNDVDPAA